MWKLAFINKLGMQISYPLSSSIPIIVQARINPLLTALVAKSCLKTTPTSDICTEQSYHVLLWRNWLARTAVNREVDGSNPSRSGIFFTFFPLQEFEMSGNDRLSLKLSLKSLESVVVIHLSQFWISDKIIDGAHRRNVIIHS